MTGVAFTLMLAALNRLARAMPAPGLARGNEACLNELILGKYRNDMGDERETWRFPALQVRP